MAGHATKRDIFAYEYGRGEDLILRPIFLDHFPGPLHDSTLAPDGELMAVCGGNIPPTIRETRAGRVVAALNRPAGKVRRVAFAKDGRGLFLACADGRVRAWQFAASPGIPTRLAGHPSEVWSLAYSHDGVNLISTADDHSLKLWDSRTGRPIRELPGHEGLVASVAVAPDDSLLASASFDKTVRLWELASGRPRAVLRGHTASVRAVAFSPDGRTLASGGTDSTVRVWDANSVQTRSVLRAHRKKVCAVAFDPRGRHLVSTGDDLTLRIMDTSTWSESLVLARQKPGEALAFSADGSVLAAGDDAGYNTAYDVGPWASRTLARVSSAPIWGLAFSPDGRNLAAACGDGMVRFSDPITGEMLLSLEGHKTRVNAVVFSPDGRTLASASHDGAIQVWTGKRARTSGH